MYRCSQNYNYKYKHTFASKKFKNHCAVCNTIKKKIITVSLLLKITNTCTPCTLNQQNVYKKNVYSL